MRGPVCCSIRNGKLRNNITLALVSLCVYPACVSGVLELAPAVEEVIHFSKRESLLVVWQA